MLQAGAAERRHRGAARCDPLGRGGRHLQARPAGLSARGRSPGRAGGRDRLPVVQRLGRQRRRVLRPAPGVDQPLQGAARAPARAGRARASRPRPRCRRCSASERAQTHRAAPCYNRRHERACRALPTSRPRPRGWRGSRAPRRCCSPRRSMRWSAAACCSRPSPCSTPARSSSAAPTTRSARARQPAVVAYSSGNHAQGVARGGAPARAAGDHRDAGRRAGDQDREHPRAMAPRSASTTASGESREAIGAELAERPAPR